MLITHFTARGRKSEIDLSHPGDSRIHYAAVAAIGFVGVGIGAYAVVRSIIILSETFGIPEFLLSFFLAAIGTSLPELVVDLTAIRKKQYQVAIGDIIGSCIVDATVSIGIGLTFFPQSVSGGLAGMTTLITLVASATVITLLAVREKVDKRAGALLLLLYISSYVALEVLLFL